ncbi:tellurite resistance TerB family protein [Lutimaribacter sp. EGI FJ00015]|uniref:Tellurite resistance TerB family protein n=1 Tax=Lutimaribacter degradans TaxID=2945989 RepID=A0ACC5ZWJ9_9RHOB|nr:DUF533 domain-containing protein [Lutimaribacter sp. EGI FJ00013]MCM2562702.1 tellurite resistance TerB family protein [Lutimaribacter sp. EGI FJ00013]MCO0613859.1 tellurite resistance TerB family protein [Lutimaribacter sp. EGI FJ00015]MCO0636658.1 tellurite resistance TerB family protein [Lutimaribacter sp. EGI FJ00014]
MSFVKTLAALTVGFAAARGVQKVKEMGGLSGVKDAMRSAGAPGGMADQMAEMAGKMGMPVKQENMRDMFNRFGGQAAEATDATEQGLASLMGAMTSAAGAGARGVSDMMATLTQGTAAGAASEENARLMIRAMIQAAKADGDIDADERKKILDHLSDASVDEITFVETALDAPVDPMALARDTGDAMRAQVYSAALMAISADTEGERTYLRGLAQALQLDDDTIGALHRGMGRPPL